MLKKAVDKIKYKISNVDIDVDELLDWMLVISIFIGVSGLLYSTCLLIM
jgi:hypothetical protein